MSHNKHFCRRQGCFEKWCRQFDDRFRTKAEKREFRHYVAGLLGESKRKNLSEIARNSVGVTYNRLYHVLSASYILGKSSLPRRFAPASLQPELRTRFATDAKWSPQEINERRLQVMNQIRQTKIQRG